jgi:hypothetical protein
VTPLPYPINPNVFKNSRVEWAMARFDHATFVTWQSRIPTHIAQLQALVGQQFLLDYSPESLDRLDDYLVNNLVNAGGAAPADDVVSWSAAYLGEAYRRYFGGEWNIVVGNPKENDPVHMYWGLPHVLIRPPAFLVCPHAEIMSRLSRLKEPGKRQVSLREVFEATRRYLAKRDARG